MRCLWAVFLGAAVSFWPANAQQASLSGPHEGLTFDLPTHSFRAVIGLAGSATFGPALAGGFDSGSVAPHASYGIGFQQGSGLLVTGLDSAQVSTSPLDGLNGQPDGLVWSGDGSVAILYSAGGNWLQVLSGLPDAPQFGPAVDLSALGAMLSGVASDQHGKRIAIALQGDNGGVFLLSDTQSFIPLLQIARPRALTFSLDGTSLFVLDGSSPQLTSLAVPDGSLQVTSLDGLHDPSAIACGRDLQDRPVLYVAGSDDQIFRVYDQATQQVIAEFPLDFKPAGIAVFGSSSFIIAPRSHSTDPLWLYSSAPRPGVYFVPAALSSPGGLD